MKDPVQSMEDYLEAVLVLRQKLASVRNIDIACYLGFSKASVSHAIKKLEQEGMIIVQTDRSIELTEQGRILAEGILVRHHFFTDWFIKIGIDPKTAEEDACKLEHVISKESFEAIKENVKSMLDISN